MYQSVAMCIKSGEQKGLDPGGGCCTKVASASNETCSFKLKDGFPRKCKQKFVSISRNKNGVLRTRDASSTNYNLINPEFWDQLNGRTHGNVPCA